MILWGKSIWGEGNSTCKGCRVEWSSGSQGTEDRPVRGGMWGDGVNSWKSLRGGEARPGGVALEATIDGVGFIPSGTEPRTCPKAGVTG